MATRIWYSVEKLLLDQDGFTKAIELGNNARIVEESVNLKDGYVYLLVRYATWDKHAE